MTDEAPAAPVRVNDETPDFHPETSANFAALGMTCAVVSAIALLYAAEVIFIEMPTVEDIYKAVKVHVGGVSQVVFDYGIAMWGAVLICVVLSFDQAFRHPGRTRTIVVNIAVLLAALGFILVIRRATLIPFWSLLQGIGH